MEPADATNSPDHASLNPNHPVGVRAQLRQCWWVATAVVLALAVLAGILLMVRSPHHNTSSAAALSALPHRATKQPQAFVEDTGAPLPTNKWFSGLVFGRPSSPVFATPLSLQTTNNAATISYAPPVVTADTIFAPHRPDVQVQFGAASQALVRSYDDLSVELAYKKGGQDVATARLTQGSPFVYYQVGGGQRAAITTTGGILSRIGNGEYLLRCGDVTYGIYMSDGQSSLDGGTLRVQAGGHGTVLSVFVLPGASQQAAYFAAAANPIVATSVQYQRQGDQITTTYSLTTASGQPAIFGLTPAQQQTAAGLRAPALGTLQTLQGDQRFYAVRSVQTRLSGVPALALSLDKLTAGQKQQIIQLLRQEIPATTFTATDSYGAGKQLYRAANLLQLAEQLGQQDLARTMRQALAGQLGQWLDPQNYQHAASRYFYYDTTVKGLVGAQPSYGSDQFNDHHFHYGYFLYATSVLAQYDPGFYQKHAGMVGLIVDDIASATASANFPKLRMFDPYNQHSWASGYGQFGDGNNQESSSEAVNAWYGLYRLGVITHTAAYADEGLWLYQQESASALQDYLNIPAGSAPYANGYAHSIVSIVWGGKLDDATWFSADPAAKLGIQLIPLSPGHAYAGTDAARAQQNLAALAREEGAAEPSQFKDYLAMYQVFSDPALARQQLAQLSESDIDSANSLAYATAWIDAFGH